MRRTRILVLVALLVVAGAVLAMRLLRDDSNPRTAATVTKVGLSPNRRVIWAKVSQYYSPSCSKAHPKVDRDGSAWRVSVSIERVAEMCTLEMCIESPDDTVPGGELHVPDGKAGAQGGCMIYAITLDAPVPPDVRLVAG